MVVGIHRISFKPGLRRKANPSLYAQATSRDSLSTLRKPEILSPAGGWPQLKAGVQAGADSCYFGVSGSTVLNARARANNFDTSELAEVMQYLHDRGVKGYLTLNILVFDSELPKLEAVARQAAAAGVDAVIVQDVGAIELIRRIAPHLHVHASTQMSITSAEGVDFASDLGVDRCVVGRELSIEEISKIASQSPETELEVFVHGALCVSYSGQCFSSEAWGGRSANRGQCAQACRLPYGMIVDGTLKDLHDMSYVLSPQDLAAVELVPDLIKSGVGCFKIEGRLKGPEYVALTTRVYKEAVDSAWKQLQDGEEGSNNTKLPLSSWSSLKQVFARGQDEVHQGLTPGFLLGPRHQDLVRGRAPRHRGNYLGKISAMNSKRNRITVDSLHCTLRKGDGLVFDAGAPHEKEQGGSVYGMRNPDNRAEIEIASPGDCVNVEFDKGSIDWRAVKPGNLLWKTKDNHLESEIRSTYENIATREMRRIGVEISVTAVVGQPLIISIADDLGNRGTAVSDQVVQEATNKGITEGDIEKAIGVHLGNEGCLTVSTFTYTQKLSELVFIPAALIKNTRRSAVAQYLERRRYTQHSANGVCDQQRVLPLLLSEIKGRNKLSRNGDTALSKPPVLRVLCRSKGQVDAVCLLPWVDEIIVDFLEVHGLREACTAVRSSRKRLVVALPRILKPGEHQLPLFYLKLQPDALLIRGAGVLHQLKQLGRRGAAVPGGLQGEVVMPDLEGDFSLNASNIISCDLFLSGNCLTRLAPTHDCNASQLQGLAVGLGARASKLEVILHQHVPIFHTEHCVFARFLSDGNSYVDCGRPCEKHTVHLRDSQGADHLVLADEGCRNTVFNAQAQSGLSYLPSLIDSGVGAFRVELVDEPANAVVPLLEGYKIAFDVLTKKSSRNDWEMVGKRVWNNLEKIPDANGRCQGIGLGSLKPTKERKIQQLKPTAASISRRS